MAIWLTSIFILLLRQLPSDHKDGVALLSQCCQKCAEVKLRQWLRRRKQRVEVPELPVDATDGEPMFLLPQIITMW